uniref:Uncharacterized protein n=1 Tax=Anguilla anguilla TaxID=7936 RepID=A0A0E9V886_ANGAN
MILQHTTHCSLPHCSILHTAGFSFIVNSPQLNCSILAAYLIICYNVTPTPVYLHVIM